MNKHTQKVMFSSKKPNWITPMEFFSNLKDEYHFTTDVGADKDNHLCSDYLGLDNGKDALTTPWGLSNFCNPPYGRGIVNWVARGYQESLLDKLVVMLIPARPDTKWFHNWVWDKASEVSVVRSRIKFSNAKSGAPFPSMVVVYDFRTRHHGTVFTRRDNKGKRIVD